jgi:hypothetical protein
MSENEKPKKELATEVIANMPKRDTYSPEHGNGSPNLDPGELRNGKAWKEHKPAKQAKPKKKA